MADLASSVIYGYLQVNDSITAPKLTLTQATGTAPMTITSTTLVSNLNVDYLDGQHGSYYLGAGNLTGTLSADRIASNSITLAKLETIPTATILGRNTTAEGNIEELSTATVKTMLNLTGTNSGDQNLFSHIHALNSSGTDVTNSPFNVTSSAEAITLKAGTNVTLAMDTSGVVTITSAYTNTATAADGIFDGTNTGTEIKYSPYSTQQTGILSFDTSATAPTRTDRLNLNGYFYATQLYEGSTRALVRKTSDTTVTTHKFALFDTSSGDIIRSPLTFNDSGTSTSELISASQVNTRIDNAVTGIAARLLPPVADLTALKAVNTTTLTDKTMINCETLGLYRLDLQSSATADDNRIVAPTTGSGRWIKMSASINDHNNLTAIQGGGTGDYQHLTTTQLGYIHASGSDNQNIFSTIAVSGQSNIVADTTSDTLTFVAGNNITLTTNATNDSVTINSTHPDITPATSVNNSGRTYIQDITVDANGHVTGLASATETVTDTNYYPTTFTWTNGTTSGPTGSLTGSGMSAVSYGAIPSASETVSGVVTTGDQTFAGAKTFTSNIVGNVTGNVSGSSGSCTGNAATATTASSCTGNSATATQAYTTANTANTLYLIGVTSTTSGNQSLQLDASTYVTSDGYLYATRVYNAVYNDYAECFDNTDLDYDKVKNRIVEITDDDKVRLGSNNSIRVVGVVSDSYGHMLGGTEEEIENGKKIPVGIAGKLYVDSKDIVDINNIGKFVGSDDEGYAKVLSDDFKSGTVVGKIIGIDKENNRYKLLLVIK